MNRRSIIAGILCAAGSLAPFGTHVIADEQSLFGYSAESSRAAPLENATEELARSAAEYHKASEQASANGGAQLASASLADVNNLLIESERKLTTSAGLPNQPWFKHQLYAPGFYTGYAVKTVPAVREAIEQKQWRQADEAIVVVAGVLRDEAALISSAAAKLAAGN